MIGVQGRIRESLLQNELFYTFLSNCGVNPLIYILRNKKIKTYFKTKICSRKQNPVGVDSTYDNPLYDL